jgi:uncharacterized OB-fold protein
MTFPEKEYFEFLSAGKFMIQRSTESGRYVFFPRLAEPVNGSPLEWVEASGRGTVYSITVLRPKPPEAMYNVALIDLDEGPRMMSRVDGMPADQVSIGMKVNARIVQENDKPLLVFEPLDAATQPASGVRR